MAQDMVLLVQMLQDGLQRGALRDFEPSFELVGSMAEATRIGLTNELDVGVKFAAWRRHVPFRVDGDPFSLKKSATSPPFMEDFFIGDEFQFHKFMHAFLEAVDVVIVEVFRSKRNPPNLKCVTTNKDWNEGKTKCGGECKRNLEERGFEQCERCTVTLSQTKSGAVLQFEYHWTDFETTNVIYCSIDLIPIFQIEPIPMMGLTRLIIEHMLGHDPPEGWLNFLFKYWKDYKIVQYHLLCGSGTVTSIGLKTMTFLEGRNHHVKPAQEFTEDKFSSERMKDIYRYIKFLKKVLHLDLSSYWVKRELLRREYETILESSENDDLALVQILSQPEFKPKFDDHVDFSESHYHGYLNWKLEGREVREKQLRRELRRQIDHNYWLKFDTTPLK